MAAPYNILFINLDDLGIDWVGCYGLGSVLTLTPQMDTVAAAGVRFNYCRTSPNCSPTRMAQMTGRLGSRTGIVNTTNAPANNGGYGSPGDDLWEPDPTEVFIATRLKTANYHTAHFGKIHLHHPTSSTGYDFPFTKLGFDDYYGWPWVFQSGPIGGSAAAGCETYQGYLYAAGVTAANGHPRIVNNALVPGASPAPGSLTSSGGNNYCSKYATTSEVDDAIAWMGGAHGGAPAWFCSVSLHSPHFPIQAPPLALYNPPKAGLVFPPGHGSAGTPVPPGQHFLALYPSFATPVKPWRDAIMYATDKEIGRLLAAVPGNTVVIITSDNGTNEQAGSDGNWIEAPFDPLRSKGTMYEGGLRVPLLVSGPAVVAGGRVSNALIQCTDFYATLHDLAGIAVDNKLHDSVSFYPILQNTAPATGIRTSSLSTYHSPLTNPANFPTQTWGRRWYALVGNHGYKLVRRLVNTPGTEFFHVQNQADLSADDQFEATNLLNGPMTSEQSRIFRHMTKQLDSWITQVEHLAGA